MRPAGPPPQRPQPARLDKDDPYDDEEYEDDGTSSRMARVMATLGAGLIAVVTAQVVAAIAEGMAARVSELEPNGVETDLLHRLGFPFVSLGAPATLFLVVALALLAIPLLLNEETSAAQERVTGIGLVAVIVLAVAIAAGSLLAVRYQLHLFTSQGVSPPPYARIGFALFLLGALGGAAVAVFGALATMNARRRA